MKRLLAWAFAFGLLVCSFASVLLGESDAAGVYAVMALLAFMVNVTVDLA